MQLAKPDTVSAVRGNSIHAARNYIGFNTL